MGVFYCYSKYGRCRCLLVRILHPDSLSMRNTFDLKSQRCNSFSFFSWQFHFYSSTNDNIKDLYSNISERRFGGQETLNHQSEGLPLILRVRICAFRKYFDESITVPIVIMFLHGSERILHKQQLYIRAPFWRLFKRQQSSRNWFSTNRFRSLISEGELFKFGRIW